MDLIQEDNLPEKPIVIQMAMKYCITCVRNSQSLKPFLSQMKPIQTLISSFFKIDFDDIPVCVKIFPLAIL